MPLYFLMDLMVCCIWKFQYSAAYPGLRVILSKQESEIYTLFHGKQKRYCITGYVKCLDLQVLFWNWRYMCNIPYSGLMLQIMRVFKIYSIDHLVLCCWF